MARPDPDDLPVLGREVTDEVLRGAVLSVLRHCCDVRGMDAPDLFPGAIPVSIRREQLALLTPDRYMVSEKTDGQRMMLLLTRLEGREAAFFVDRRCRVFATAVAADRAHFDNTLLDGELVGLYGPPGSPQRATYFVFDLHACAGRNVRRRAFPDRQAGYHALLAEADYHDWDPDQRMGLAAGSARVVSLAWGLSLLPKPFHPLPALRALCAAGLGARYPVDGLIFMPLREPVALCTQTTQFKWKWRHTVDLRVDGAALRFRTRLGGRRWEADVVAEGFSLDEAAYVGQRQACPGAPVRRLACSDPERLAAMLAEAEPEADPKKAGGGPVVEFALEYGPDGAGVVLCPVGVRPDKGEPNNDWTLQQTYLNLMEGVGLRDLCDAAEGREAPTKRPRAAGPVPEDGGPLPAARRARAADFF